MYFNQQDYISSTMSADTYKKTHLVIETDRPNSQYYLMKYVRSCNGILHFTFETLSPLLLIDHTYV